MRNKSDRLDLAVLMEGDDGEGGDRPSDRPSGTPVKRQRGEAEGTEADAPSTEADPSPGGGDDDDRKKRRRKPLEEFEKMDSISDITGKYPTSGQTCLLQLPRRIYSALVVHEPNFLLRIEYDKL